MGVKAIRMVLVAAMLLVGLLLALSVAYMIRGSLEEFPTAEDHETVRVVTAGLAAGLLVAGGALVFAWRSVGQRQTGGAQWRR